MGLFSPEQEAQINAVAAKSKEVLKPIQVSKSITSTQYEIEESTRKVLEYFKDSPAILITSVEQLHDYITEAIKSGYCAIDTETTGLDVMQDTIVGSSLYYPGGVECYIPNKHIIPIFETPYKNQLTYAEVGKEFQRFVDAGTKTIWYHADFDMAFLWKDYGVNMTPAFYYDCMLAWRCLKENEDAHGLKPTYNKYVLRGKGDPMKFSDFFTHKLYPYSRPEVAKLYAANDAKITYELFMWQLPYVTKTHPKCQKHHLERIADLVWNIEMPMERICATMHQTGVYLDLDTSAVLGARYHAMRDKEFAKLVPMIQPYMDQADSTTLRKSPFKTAETFNPNSNPQIEYLLNGIMQLGLESTKAKDLEKLDLPIVKQLSKVRSIDTILGSFVDKLPNTLGTTGRVHSTFNSIGADCITGNSLLLTDKGYLPIKNLFTGEEPNGDYSEDYVRVINKDLKYEVASHKVVYYKTPTIRLRLRGGYTIEGTPNHPIICSVLNKADVRRTPSNLYHLGDNTEFRQLGDVAVGDAVCIPLGYNIFPTEYVPTGFTLKAKYKGDQLDCKVPEYFTEDFAELMGIYFADGSIHDACGHFSIRISNKDEEVIQRTIELVDQVFGLPAKKVWGHTTWTTEFGNKRIECIRSVLGRRAENKYIHWAIMQSPKSVVCAFIRGTTLDSSYDAKRQRLAIHYYRKDAADFVHQVLANLGIASSLTVQNPNARTAYTHYRVSVSGEYYRKFIDIVGVVQSSKRDIRDTYTHSKFVVKDDQYFAYVESIGHSIEDVFDLTVPGTHSFIAQGIINHNTGRMSSKSPNVQNIPSHALDVRHMFRATPAMEKIDVCDQTENGIEVTIGLYDTVYMADNTEKDVIDLQIGDVVKLLKDNKEVNAVVKSISNQAPYAGICFDV